MSERAESLLGTREVRTSTNVDTRDSTDEFVIEGYASVFDYRYDIFGGPDAGGWTEIVERGAFDDTLAKKPDVSLLLQHHPGSLAKTKSGTLQLRADDHGLAVRATLDPKNPKAAEALSQLRRGDVDEMSFAFRTVRDKWNRDETERRLLEVNIHKGDVSLVDYGANPATTVQLRKFADAIGLMRNIEPEAALAEIRASVDNPLEALAEAHRCLGELLKRATPNRRRCYSVAEARAIHVAPR